MEIYVVIPAYNAEKYIFDTVQSVLQQPYKRINIIIVDDGSVDNTLKRCRELEEMYSQICVISQMNGGVSNARNTGIEYVLKNTAANDAYIAFLDSDDLWYPDYLTNALVEELASEQHDIYAFAMLNSNEKADRFSWPQRYEKQTVAGGNPGIWSITNHFASCFYRITLFKKWRIRFLSGYKYSEDKYFRLQCAFFAKSIQLRSELVYIYRENSAGAMKKVNAIKPIDYYLPIINGWLEIDRVINSWEQETGTVTDSGHVLANVYFLDMAAAHFQQWRPVKEIRETLENHPHYPLFLQMQPMGSHDVNFENQQLYLHHPQMYAWKYRLQGLVENPLRAISGARVLRWLLNHKKYPLKKLP